MTQAIGPKGLNRRQLLLRTSAAGASFMIGSSFISAKDAVWAAEVSVLKPQTFATLVQMARDIYPHDRIADEFYVVAVRGYDNSAHAEEIEVGIANLDEAARSNGHAGYLDVGWELDRVDILRSIEESAFFQKVRGGLVTSLYNQKAVWPIFGYEGESYSEGGYIDRGFNDINWL